MRIVITILISISFLWLQAQNTETMTLSPTQDAYFSGSRGINSDELRIKAGKQSTALKFNISGLDIVSATLEMTLVNNGNGGEIAIYEADSDANNWDDVGLAPKPTRRNDMPLASINESSYTPETTYSWDLAVDEIESPDSLTVLALRTSGSKYNAFASKEHNNAAFRPKLILVVNTDNGGGDDDNGDDNNDDNDGGNDDGNDGDNNDDGDDDGNNGGGTAGVWNLKEDGTIYYNGGNVGIGTNDPITKLAVDGEIRATKVRVRGDINIPDYVFEADYELKSIEEVEAYIKANKHLPEVPSAKEIEAEGLSLGDMDATLLKKIEELTLYIIELKKEIEVLKAEKENKEEK